MAIKHPFIRFATFPYNTPIQFVINDINNIELYRNVYAKLQIFFPDDPKRKVYEMIIPRYKFLMQYLKYPIRERKEVGSKNILIEMERIYENQQVNIRKIARFTE